MNRRCIDMGDITMATVGEICSKPFIDLLRKVSDYPIMSSLFVSIITAIVNQSLASGFIAFGGCLALLGIVYVVTFGKAFGRGGTKNRCEHRG